MAIKSEIKKRAEKLRKASTKGISDNGVITAINNIFDLADDIIDGMIEAKQMPIKPKGSSGK